MTQSSTQGSPTPPAPEEGRSRLGFPPKYWPFWIAGVFGLIGLSLGLAWLATLCVDCSEITASGSITFQSWLSFLAVCSLGAAILWLGWRGIQASERGAMGAPLPRWLAGLLIGAALLRLAMGIVWYLALPQFGHGTNQEQDGYVMSDAFERDQLAQKVALSQKSLWNAYRTGAETDPLGGLYFSSVLIYRYLGTDQPNPLSIIVITAAFSALAVIFTWAFARRSWNGRVAQVAAWGIALYPEAVLLGSSQMREAIAIPLVAAAFYGLARLRRERSWIGLAWLLGGLLFAMVFSPPYTLLLLAALALAALAVKDDLLHRHVEVPRWAWGALVGVILVVLLGGWFSISRFAPPEITNPVDILSYWIGKSIDLQAYFSRGASGWVQKIFRTTPEWSHLTILAGYGILRPFLPAALTVSSAAPIWSWITLWRALGWTILLGMLGYALLRAWLNKDSDNFTRMVTVIIWLGIVIASLRGGGDQDDNPRYRAAFASIQISMAAWAWVEQRRTADPVFRRAAVTLGFVILWALVWYLRRIYPIPWGVADPFKTIGLGLACGALYSIWDWARGYKRDRL